MLTAQLSSIKCICTVAQTSQSRIHRTFHLPNWKSVLIKHWLPILLPQHLVPTILLSVLMPLTPLGTSHKWNHAESNLLWLLIMLGIVSSSFMRAVAGVRIAFLFKAEQYPTVWIHTFCLHSSVTGYSGCFRILAVLNNVTMKIGVQKSFQYLLYILLGIIPEMYCCSIW